MDSDCHSASARSNPQWVKIDRLLALRRFQSLYQSLRETSDKRGDLPRLNLYCLMLDFLAASGVEDLAGIIQVMGKDDARIGLGLTDCALDLLLAMESVTESVTESVPV